jgi:hypothetical protein
MTIIYVFVAYLLKIISLLRIISLSMWITDKYDNLSWPIVMRVQDFILRIIEKLLSHESDEIGEANATWSSLKNLDKQFYLSLVWTLLTQI